LQSHWYCFEITLQTINTITLTLTLTITNHHLGHIAKEFSADGNAAPDGSVEKCTFTHKRAKLCWAEQNEKKASNSRR
jgi:hypothetical protein